MQGVQARGRGGSLRQTAMGGDEGRGTEAREPSGALDRAGRLCQHVPETAATQSRPAGGQARVCCVVSSPVLHHVDWETDAKTVTEGGGRCEKKRHGGALVQIDSSLN